jgi:hypothetical protein
MIPDDEVPTAAGSDDDWLTLLYALQQHIRFRLADGLLEELQKRIEEHQIETAGFFDLAKNEIEQSMYLLGPGLLVDFLSYHPSLITPDRLRAWAKEYQAK